MFDPNMMEGPSVAGNWYNKRTGQTVTIRDSFMDDSGMQFMTSTGEMIDGEVFSRDYIQCDDTVYDTNGNATSEKSEIDYEAMFGSPGQYEQPILTAPTTTMQQTFDQPKAEPVNEKTKMLKTMFDKLTHLPKVEVKISWNKIPSAELEMLKSYFDINNEDIANFIYDNYCTEVEIREAVAKSITSLLNKKDK